MKTLIIYGTRKGFTEFCARQLAEKLDAETLSADKANAESLKETDILILGSSIWKGRITRSLSNFINANSEQILKKKLGLFICSGDTDRDYAAENYPEQLRSHATLVDNFGGRIRL